MCWTQHDGNYHNLLTHTLDRRHYAGLKVLFIVEAILVETIIPLFKEFSIGFWGKFC